MPNRLSVLVVVSDERVRHPLCERLREEGFFACETENGLGFSNFLQSSVPGAVILDADLDGGEGIDMCHRLRLHDETKFVPMILLTPEGDADERIRGLQVGADDVVTKPFNLDELILRLHAVIRRSAQEPRSQYLDAGPFQFDLHAFKLTVNGEDKALSRVEFKLLYFLVSKARMVVPRDLILRQVWPQASGSNSRTLDTHIKRLRIKLAPHSGWIKTARGLGYEFSDPESEGGGP